MKHLLLPGALAVASAFPACAQTAQLDPVTVTAQRSPQSTFDAPAAISAVSRETIEGAGLQVNLSEALNRAPGITVLNRQNYAQDLQLSIRGFGARSTFGIRGVRLIVDGIPATMPDGQGQASSIALSSTARIEVLRGPLAQLYGNAAGGVVQVFSEDGAAAPGVSTSVGTGRDGQLKLGVKVAAGGATDGVLLDASRFRTDGYREHSAAQRDQINAKWTHELGGGSRISLVANSLDQPTSLDPGGLTRALLQADPKQSAAIFKTQDARKSVAQQQLGSVWEQRLAPATTLTTRVYFGTRDLDNALSVAPPTPQTPNTTSGGIVSFARAYSGLGLQLAHTVPLSDTRSLRLTGGLDYDRMAEDRKGFDNIGGLAGGLRRNEHNTVSNRDAYVQAAVDFASAWAATFGVRSSHVRFETQDFFIKAGTPNNGDDSGSVSYSATNPVLGLTWHVLPSLNAYVNVGRGFETPTFTELAYRPNNASGPNFGLKASRSRHAELGAKWKLAEGHRIDAAVYDIATSNELVVDTNSGGRSTFKNAGRTSRRGVELQYLGQLGADWRTTVALNALRARFQDSFTTVPAPGAAAITIPAGNRLPGTPERSLFAELAYAPAQAWGGFNAGIELIHVGKLYVADSNEDAAAASTVVNLRAGFAQKAGAWSFTELLRVDNAADKAYVGSVIVNDANKRFFEPAPPRAWLLGVTAKYEFR